MVRNVFKPVGLDEKRAANDAALQIAVAIGFL